MKKELVMKQKMRGSNPFHLIIPTAKKFSRYTGVHRYMWETNLENLTFANIENQMLRGMVMKN